MLYLVKGTVTDEDVRESFTCAAEAPSKTTALDFVVRRFRSDGYDTVTIASAERWCKRSGWSTGETLRYD